MFTSIRNLLRKPFSIFYQGIHPDMPFAEVQKTFLFNFFLMIGLPFIIPGIPINFGNGQYYLACFNCLLLLLYTIGLWINITRKYIYLRQAIFLLTSVIYMIGPVFFRNGTEYNLLITLIGAVILFDNFLFILLSLFVIASVTYIRVRDVNLAAINSFARASPYINIFYSQFLFALSVYAFKYIYFKYQAQLEISYQNLKRSKEAKDKILRVIAHDLRSPVGGIQALSTLLLEQKPDEMYANYLQMIQRSAHQSLSMINQILHEHADKTSDLIYEPADIVAVAKNAGTLMLHAANEKQQQLFINVPDDSIHVMMDAEKMTRVIQNLLSNAVKFTKPGGNIHLEVSLQNSLIRIAVRDNGIGMAATMIDKLFVNEAYTKRLGTAGEKSFGIGLLVCKQILEDHGSSLQIESEEGKGSSFYFDLLVI